MIDKANRIHPAHIETAFESTYEVLFGCIMNLVANVNVLLQTPEWKKRMASVQFERMAEYHELGLAVEKIMDWPESTFENALDENILDGYKAVIDANPTAIIIMKYVKAVFVNGITTMEKSTNDWHYTFNNFLENEKPLQKNLDKSPDALGTSFARIKPTLRHFGIKLEKKKAQQHNLWVLSKLNSYVENSSTSSTNNGTLGTLNTENFQPSLEDYPEKESAPIAEPVAPEVEKEVLERQDHTGMPWEENQN